jgi:hypothetical protein
MMLAVLFVLGGFWGVVTIWGVIACLEHPSADERANRRRESTAAPLWREVVLRTDRRVRKAAYPPVPVDDLDEEMFRRIRHARLRREVDPVNARGLRRDR